jgi:hypothetical protein
VLEKALEQRFRNPQDPQAGAALDMWLSVQQARLRTHTPEQRRAHRVNQFLQAGALLETWRLYHASPERPEYPIAVHNFMRIIGDMSVSDAMRLQVAQRLAYHCGREGTVPMDLIEEIRQAATPEWRQYLSGAIPADEPHSDLAVGAFAIADSVRSEFQRPPQPAAVLSALQQDLAQQRDPLSCEISGWLAAAKQDELPQASAFDDEALAISFARLLARRRPSQENCSPEAGKVLQDGARVIRAIAEDPELRGTVFKMAEDALSRCGDRVAEGFSNIVLAVSRHQMVKAVERGEVDAASLNRDTRQCFRLAVLEHEVHRRLAEILKPIEASLTANQQAADKLKSTEATLTTNEQAARKAGGPLAAALRHGLANQRTELQQTKLRLADERKVFLQLQHKPKNEPVETMLHAKVQLARQLDLPKDLPTTMTYESESVLKKEDLDSIAAAIRASEAEGSALRAFVLDDPEKLWLTAMKKLHAEELQSIWNKYDEDPVWDEDPHPREGETFADWKAGYESRCHAVRQKAEAAELELLFRLASM